MDLPQLEEPPAKPLGIPEDEIYAPLLRLLELKEDELEQELANAFNFRSYSSGGDSS